MKNLIQQCNEFVLGDDVEGLEDFLHTHRGLNLNAITTDKYSSKVFPHCPTPLMIAAHEGFSDCAQLLLNFGSSPLTKNQKGNTALHLATEFDHQDILMQLVKAGGNIHAKDHDGFDVLASSVKNNATHCLKYLIDILSDPCPSFSHDLEYAKDLLHTSIFYESKECLKILLKCNLPLDIVFHGLTPYEYAKKESCFEMAEMILEAMILREKQQLSSDMIHPIKTSHPLRI